MSMSWSRRSRRWGSRKRPGQDKDSHMKTLVWVEHDNASVKDATLSAVTAASQLGEVHLLVAGKGCAGVADEAAKIAGVGKVHLADDAAYEHALAENIAQIGSASCRERVCQYV